MSPVAIREMVWIRRFQQFTIRTIMKRHYSYNSVISPRLHREVESSVSHERITQYQQPVGDSLKSPKAQ